MDNKISERASGINKRAIVMLLSNSIGNILFGIYLYSSGYFYVELMNMFGEGAIKTSLIGTLNSSLACFLAPFATLLMNRYSARLTIFSGVLLISAGCFLSAFVRSIKGLIITFGVIAGTGNALAIIPSMVTPGFYFVKYRHLVLTAAPVFNSIGMFVSTPVSAFIISKLGIRGSYIIMSGLILQICVFATIYKPSDVELNLMKAYKDRKNGIVVQREPEDKTKGKQKQTNQKQTNRKQTFLIHFSFFLFLISTTISNAVFGTFQLHLPHYLEMNNNISTHTQSIMTVLGIGNALGRVFATIMMMKESKIGLQIHATSLLLSGITSIVYPIYGHNIPLHYAVAFVIGLTTGAPFSALASIILNILGLQKMSNAFGIALFYCGVGLLGGILLSSYLLDIYGTYSISFIVIGCASLFGCFCASITKLFVRNYNTSD